MLKYSIGLNVVLLVLLVNAHRLKNEQFERDQFYFQEYRDWVSEVSQELTACQEREAIYRAAFTNVINEVTKLRSP